MIKLFKNAILILLFCATSSFAQEPTYINYKIKMDTNQEYEDILEKNKELFKNSKSNKLFLNWIKRGQDATIDGSKAFKKPSFDVNIAVKENNSDYIRCLEETNTD